MFDATAGAIRYGPRYAWRVSLHQAEEGSTRSHGYMQNTNPEYMLTIVGRGIDALTGSRRIGRDVAESLRAEARRRAEAGEFFGHIGYVGVVGRRPTCA